MSCTIYFIHDSGLPESIDCEQKRLNLEDILKIEANAVKCIHTYIFTS